VGRRGARHARPAHARERDLRRARQVEKRRDADIEKRAKKLEADLAELEAEGAKADVRRKVKEGGEREMRQIRDRAQREIDRLDEVWTPSASSRSSSWIATSCSTASCVTASASTSPAAWAPRRSEALLENFDLDAEAEKLRETIRSGKAGDPAGPASAGAARRRPLRDLRPERPLPPRHQPQQPPEAADRAARARHHRPQREAHAAGGRRRAVRQRPPRPRHHRRQQASAEVAVRHAQGQAGPLPPEPARQARRLLRPFGHRGRSRAQAAPVRPAEEDGARAVQAVHLSRSTPRAGHATTIKQAKKVERERPRSGTSSKRSSASIRCC
jgi:hypothetical protein